MKKFSTFVLITLLTLESFGALFLAPKLAYALTPPTFIQEAETVWNDSVSPKTTDSFDVLAGDVLVAFAIKEHFDSNNTNSNDPITISGGSLSWNNEQTVQVNAFTWVGIWTATVDTNKSMTVSFSDTDTDNFGGNVFTFRGSDGVGTSSKNNQGSGGPTLNITTEAADSAVVVVNSDWDANDGASRVWRENAGTLEEQTYFFQSSSFTGYGGYHSDAGPASTYAVGLSTPGQRYSIAAVEILGSEAEPAAGRIIRLKGGVRLLGGVRLR